MNYPRRVSPKRLAELGWTRWPGFPWPSYEHIHGWGLRHCGHHTAHHPWMLYDPKGFMVLTGAGGEFANPDFGTHWPTITAAVEYVATQTNVEMSHNEPEFSLQFAGESIRIDQSMRRQTA